jgi:predicted RNA-binding Zn-ribbon protein involved in translation (DUF1610 family)
MTETKSVALFACPHCVDNFAFDWQKVRNLAARWRVMVRCPGCGNVIEVVMRGYQVIHNCDPTTYKQGEIVEILPPDAKTPPSLDYSLHMAIHRKKYGWR